ncbi:MAG: rhodanese-like domain-containing protein [Polyangiaceae bacterium]|jgi:rhodanese-related sulfurtransferase|nr:rhodanese-like domain-containing protein [Polyangiaceae bacterium]
MKPSALLLALLATTSPLAGCSKEAGGSATPGASAGATANQLVEASPEEVKKLIAQGAVVVDVREKDEVSDGKLTVAKEFPFYASREEAQWTKFTAGLPRDKPVVVYCASGGRSERIGDRLAKMGFKAFNGGGYDALARAGLPTGKP